MSQGIKYTRYDLYSRIFSSVEKIFVYQQFIYKARYGKWYIQMKLYRTLERADTTVTMDWLTMVHETNLPWGLFLNEQWAEDSFHISIKQERIQRLSVTKPRILLLLYIKSLWMPIADKWTKTSQKAHLVWAFNWQTKLRWGKGTWNGGNYFTQGQGQWIVGHNLENNGDKSIWQDCEFYKWRSGGVWKGCLWWVDFGTWIFILLRTSQ